MLAPLSDTLINSINYINIELSKVTIEDDGNVLVVVLSDRKDRLILSDKSIETLAKILEIPKKFAKKLQDEGRSHIIAYLQAQLSVCVKEPVYIVYGEKEVKAFSTKETLPIIGKDFLTMDEKFLANGNIEIGYREIRGNTLSYYFFGEKRPINEDKSVTTSEWSLGYLFNISLHGLEKPSCFIQAVRQSDMSRVIIDEVDLEKRDGLTVTDKVLGILKDKNFKSRIDAYWNYLIGYVKKLYSINASMKETKEIKDKLVRALKVDKDDKETKERIEKELHWKDLVEAYDIKTMSTKPTKLWYAKASTPYSLWSAFNLLTRESAAAPLDVEEKKIKCLTLKARKTLEGVPDLSEKPPVVEFK